MAKPVRTMLNKNDTLKHLTPASPQDYILRFSWEAEDIYLGCLYMLIWHVPLLKETCKLPQSPHWICYNAKNKN